MTTIARVTQADTQVGLTGQIARVTTLDISPALDIATTVRVTQLSAQVALAYTVPRVTQVNAQAAAVLVNPTRTSVYIIDTL